MIFQRWPTSPWYKKVGVHWGTGTVGSHPRTFFYLVSLQVRHSKVRPHLEEHQEHVHAPHQLQPEQKEQRLCQVSLTSASTAAAVVDHRADCGAPRWLICSSWAQCLKCFFFFSPFQLRWPWSWGLWEQVEHECSVEVFETGREGHHMWVKVSPSPYGFNLQAQMMDVELTLFTARPLSSRRLLSV